jgi:hypothetical protein
MATSLKGDMPSVCEGVHVDQKGFRNRTTSSQRMVIFVVIRRRLLRVDPSRRYAAFDSWNFELTTLFLETQGGLLVMDLSTKTIVQRIPEIRVYAHIEYDCGYLIAAGRGTSISTSTETKF